MSKKFITSEIYTTDKETFEITKECLKEFPVFIKLESPSLDDIENKDNPCYIMGMDNLKKLFPEHNALDSKIKENVYWGNDKTEDKKNFLKDVKDFVTKAVIDWLPDDFFIFDGFVEQDLDKFLRDKIDRSKNIFIYFHSGALYMHNNDKNFIINVQSLDYFHDSVKTYLTNILGKYKLHCFSYKNVNEILDLDKVEYFSFKDVVWIKNKMEVDEKNVFNIIPNLEYHKYIPFFLSMLFNESYALDEKEEKFYRRLHERNKITEWLSSRSICVKESFKPKDTYNIGKKFFLNVNFSNKRTVTGRIMAKDKFNIQNIPKNDGSRKNIISRFERGRILVCDYISFEPRIAMQLTRNKDFIDFYHLKDIHYELAKAIFNKEELNDFQRSIAKSVNNNLIYGASDGNILKIISGNVADPELSLYNAKKMMKPVIDLSEHIIELCKKQGYLRTHKNYIIYPNKDYAAFNNFIQNTASEILVDKLFLIKSILSNKKSEFLFQVHDSLVFDIHPSEKKVINEILITLSKFKKSSFPVSYSLGENYSDFLTKGTYVY